MDSYLFSLTSILVIISIVMSYSLTGYTTQLLNVTEYHFFIRQSIVGCFVIFMMWGLGQFNPDKYVKQILMLILIIFLGITIIISFLPASIASEVGGAKRWIKLGFISIAPSEFFRLGFIFILALTFKKKIFFIGDKPLSEELKLIKTYTFLIIFIAFFIGVLQKDLGQFSVMFLTFVVLLNFSNRSKLLISSLIGSSVFLLILLIVTSDYRISRFLDWWGQVQDIVFSFLPFLDSYFRVETVTKAYQVTQSINAIFNGGMWGVGIGDGNIKMGFLTEVHTDFIIAGISEEIGFIGVSFIYVIYLAIFIRLLQIANHSEDIVYRLFTVGVAVMLMFSFLINIYGITGLTPVKGIAVPFLSYGGSSLLASGLGIGLILSISKKTKI